MKRTSLDVRCLALSVLALTLAAAPVWSQSQGTAPDRPAAAQHPKSAVLKAARLLAIDKFLTVGSARRLKNGALDVPVGFREKRGYRFDDLVKFMKEIESSSAYYVARFNFGKRDMDDGGYWRPSWMTVGRVDPTSSVLARLEVFSKMITKIEKATDATIKLTKLSFHGAEIRWSMLTPREQTTDILDRLLTQGRKLPAFTNFKPGTIRTFPEKHRPWDRFPISKDLCSVEDLKLSFEQPRLDARATIEAVVEPNAQVLRLQLQVTPNGTMGTATLTAPSTEELLNAIERLQKVADSRGVRTSKFARTTTGSPSCAISLFVK